MDEIKFGTDGWRGQIAEDYTFENVRRCTQGFANFLIQKGKQGQPIVVGFDRRFDSDLFAAASAEVLAGNGFRVLLTDSPTPTPVISFSVPAMKACGAINITASHNPATDNGFKVRGASGGAIDPQGLLEIESVIPNDLSGIHSTPISAALSSGAVRRFDAAPRYIEQVRGMLDLESVRQADLSIVFDPMWGNGAGWMERLVGGGKLRILEIHSERNPLFPDMLRPEPIRPNVDTGLRTTVEQHAHALFITDGDADRVGFGDEHGTFINQLQVYGLLALYLLEVRGLRGPIIKTLSTTSMLEILGKKFDVPVYETGVGFKYVAPKMIETNALIGGEESGGFAFRGHVPERDGILASLFLLDMMIRLHRSPADLVKHLSQEVGGEFYYDRVDVRPSPAALAAALPLITHAKPKELAGLRVTRINTTDGFKYMLEDGGWMLVRFSGTEPILRVYCETTHADKVRSLLDAGVRMLGIPSGP